MSSLRTCRKANDSAKSTDALLWISVSGTKVGGGVILVVGPDHFHPSTVDACIAAKKKHTAVQFYNVMTVTIS